MAFGRDKAPPEIPPQADFDWAELIKLGHAEIDAQHDRMFLLADALVESLVAAAAGGTTRNPLELLHAFIDSTYRHFQFEEELMRSEGYPEAERHAQEHGALLKRIAEHSYMFELGQRNIAQISKFLRVWIGQHVDATDRELVVWLASRESPGRE